MDFERAISAFSLFILGPAVLIFVAVMAYMAATGG